MIRGPIYLISRSGYAIVENAISTPVQVGDKAPDLTLPDSTLSPKTLIDFEGKVTVMAIYPSIDTGICAAQNRKFNEMATKLSGDVVVLSCPVTCLLHNRDFVQQKV